MIEQLDKKTSQLSQKLTNQRDVLNSLNHIVKSQAMRALKLQSVFKFKRSQQQIFQTILGNNNIQCYTQYSQLLSQQISNKITNFIKSIDQLRIAHKKLQTQIKTNKQKADKSKQQIKQIQVKVEELSTKIVKFWRQQSYLMANYRLDIAAKQLEKWSKVFEYNINQKEVEKQIDALF